MSVELAGTPSTETSQAMADIVGIQEMHLRGQAVFTARPTGFTNPLAQLKFVVRFLGEALGLGYADGEWQDIEVMLPKRLQDGSFSDGLLRRRWTGDAWEYRLPTPAEEYHYRIERDL